MTCKQSLLDPNNKVLSMGPDFNQTVYATTYQSPSYIQSYMQRTKKYRNLPKLSECTRKWTLKMQSRSTYLGVEISWDAEEAIRWRLCQIVGLIHSITTASWDLRICPLAFSFHGTPRGQVKVICCPHNGVHAATIQLYKIQNTLKIVNINHVISGVRGHDLRNDFFFLVMECHPRKNDGKLQHCSNIFFGW
jgi:hypothetical protein